MDVGARPSGDRNDDCARPRDIIDLHTITWHLLAPEAGTAQQAAATYLERVGGLLALAGDNPHAVDQRDDPLGDLLLEFDLRVEQLEPLHARLASVVQHQILWVPAFLWLSWWSGEALLVWDETISIDAKRQDERIRTLKKPPGECSDRLPHLTMRCVSSMSVLSCLVLPCCLCLALLCRSELLLWLASALLASLPLTRAS